MPAIADYDDMVAFYEAPTIAEFLSDDGDPVENPAADDKLVLLLQAATGRLESACEVSGLYTPEQLAALSGNSLALAKEIVCALAMVSLVRRRPEKFGSEYWQAVKSEYEEYLDRLRKGERLFDDSTHKKANAGLPTIDGPTAVELSRNNLLTSRVRNYLPAAGHRLPLGRQ